MPQISGSLFGRKLGLTLLGVAGAAVMFTSGALVARATMDEDTNSPPPGSRDIGAVAPNMSTGGASTASTDADLARTREIRLACEGTVGNGLIAAGAIDPAKLGFELKLPGEGFTLQSVTVRSEGGCDDQGNPIQDGGKLVVDTRWRHDESGLATWVSQRLDAEPIANVLGLTSGSFWVDGYAYTLGVDQYRTLMAEDTGSASAQGSSGSAGFADAPTTVDPAPASSSGSGVASTSRAAAPAGNTASMPAPAQNADPRAQEVFQLLVSRLAPTIPDECFARQHLGGWSDLAAIGLGDPRGAIPSGFAEQYADILVWQPAASSCGGPAPEFAPDSLGAAWTSGSSTITISAYGATGNETSPGYASEGSINWTNGVYWLNVNGWGNNGPLTDVDLRPIAAALDPGFAQRCIAYNTIITEADLAARGVPAPAAPDGYKLESSTFSGSKVEGDCTGAAASDGFHGVWMFAKDSRSMLEVSANKAPDGGSTGNYEDSYGFYWTNAAGVNFSVHLYKESAVDKDLLVEVAKSIDPTFDRSKLSEGGQVPPDAKPLPMPMPVR